MRKKKFSQNPFQKKRGCSQVLGVVVCSLFLAGCMAGDPPLPPREALAQASARIGAILKEERSISPHTPANPPSEPSGKPNEITFWCPAHPLLAPLTIQSEQRERFQRAHPGIQLDAQFIGEWPIAIQKLTVALAVDEPPDVAVIKRNLLPRLIDSGRLAPISAVAPPQLLANIHPAFHATLSFDGQLFALPAGAYCSVLFYNPQLVPEAPKTWDALVHAARAIRQTHPELPGVIGDYPYLEALWSAGGDVCADSRSALDEPPALEALDFLFGLREERLAPRACFGAPDAAIEWLLAGRLAMTVAGSQHLPATQPKTPGLAIAPVPGKSGPISRLSSDVIVVFRKHAEEKTRAIAALLDWLTGSEMQGAAALARGAVPVRLDSPAETPPVLEQALNAARDLPLAPPLAEIEYELDRALNRARRWDGARPK